MKFLGTPNSLIRMNIRKNMLFLNKPIGRFDNNGIFETDNIKIIDRMKGKFQVYEDIPAISNTLKHCKKCDFTCENQGELLAHYRAIHPKEN